MMPMEELTKLSVTSRLEGLAEIKKLKSASAAREAGGAVTTAAVFVSGPPSGTPAFLADMQEMTNMDTVTRRVYFFCRRLFMINELRSVRRPFLNDAARGRYGISLFRLKYDVILTASCGPVRPVSLTNEKLSFKSGILSSGR